MYCSTCWSRPMFTMLSYSSLAVVLLTATLASSKVIALHVALGLVLGANLGSGLLAMLNTVTSPAEARRVNLGNLLFRLARLRDHRAAACRTSRTCSRRGRSTTARVTVYFHLLFNIAIAGGVPVLHRTDRATRGTAAARQARHGRSRHGRAISTRPRSTRRRWRSATPRARRSGSRISSSRCSSAC